MPAAKQIEKVDVETVDSKAAWGLTTGGTVAWGTR
jgi:hypothetical protein